MEKVFCELFDISMYEDIKLNYEVKEYLESLGYELIWKSEPFEHFLGYEMIIFL